MKNKLVLYIGVAAALTCLWLLMIFLPLKRERLQVLEQITETEKQLVDIDQTLKELPVFLKESSNLEMSKTRLQSSLYAKADILKLFRQISDRAAARKLTITEIVPSVEELLQLNKTVQNPNQPHFLNITLYIKGDYIGFGQLVSELERAPFFRGINRCNINSSPDLSRDVMYSISFKALLGNVEETS